MTCLLKPVENRHSRVFLLHGKERDFVLDPEAVRRKGLRGGLLTRSFSTRGPSDMACLLGCGLILGVLGHDI